MNSEERYGCLVCATMLGVGLGIVLLMLFAPHISAWWSRVFGPGYQP